MKVWFSGGPHDGRELEVEDPLPPKLYAVEPIGPSTWPDVKVHVGEYVLQRTRGGGTSTPRYAYQPATRVAAVASSVKAAKVKVPKPIKPL